MQDVQGNERSNPYKFKEMAFLGLVTYACVTEYDNEKQSC